MNINYGPVPTFDWIELKKLKIDDSYQRDTQSLRSQINISKIVENFSWDKFSPISVSENTDGTFNIIDGQHRVEAIRQLGDIDKVPCWVIPGCACQKQAEAFIGINKNRVLITPYAKYKAEILAGDPLANQVNDFCSEHNIIIPKNTYVGQEPNITNALGTIRSFLKKGRREDLIFAIEIIRQAFPFKPGQLKADIIFTLAELHLFYKQKIDRDVLVETIRSCEDVNNITLKARQLAKLDKSQNAKSCHQKIVINEYNLKYRALKQKKLGGGIGHGL